MLSALITLAIIVIVCILVIYAIDLIGITDNRLSGILKALVILIGLTFFFMRHRL